MYTHTHTHGHRRQSSGLEKAVEHVETPVGRWGQEEVEEVMEGGTSRRGHAGETEQQRTQCIVISTWQVTRWQHCCAGTFRGVNVQVAGRTLGSEGVNHTFMCKYSIHCLHWILISYIH